LQRPLYPNIEPDQAVYRSIRDVRLSLNSGAEADIARGPRSADFVAKVGWERPRGV